ncbi:sigma-70 family RNA polymerase sigma factor [Paraburkholderia phosphatilytica]|uniref:sigma-70 family RNA polymerase sigma factor n=1 Tax=Paraburkholderia phosphatilytica TaxID=2282883 RepID=UPI000E4F0548|nr:sigma-70 family RNA polymerase sigma factor [Paraburkholderia phosphatilytica]
MTTNPDDKMFRFEAQRARLVALAYRMLGSRAEAEDIVQDAWLKWHAADAATLQSPDAWLTTITARLAIDRLRHLQRERAAHEAGWLPEPWLDELAPSAEEQAAHASEISYGVMLLLERLKPEERAAFVLHEAFDCDYAEIARILERPAATCRQIVHRAKERLQRDGAPSKPADPAAHARIVARLRAVIDAQDRIGLMQLFEGERTEDEEVMAVARAFAVGSRMQQEAQHEEAQHEAVSVNGAVALARIEGGEVTALFAIATNLAGDAISHVTLIDDPRCLWAVNEVVGARAVRRLLQRIFASAAAGAGATASTTSTVCGHFPVDVHA